MNKLDIYDEILNRVISDCKKAKFNEEFSFVYKSIKVEEHYIDTGIFSSSWHLLNKEQIDSILSPIQNISSILKKLPIGINGRMTKKTLYENKEFRESFKRGILYEIIITVNHNLFVQNYNDRLRTFLIFDDKKIDNSFLMQSIEFQKRVETKHMALVSMLLEKMGSLRDIYIYNSRILGGYWEKYQKDEYIAGYDLEILFEDIQMKDLTNDYQKYGLARALINQCVLKNKPEIRNFYLYLNSERVSIINNKSFLELKPPKITHDW